MELKTIKVKRKYNPEESDQFLGKFADKEHYDITINESCIIRDEESNQLLAVVLKKAMDIETTSEFYHAVHNDITSTNNRGVSSGQKLERAIKKDGTISNTGKYANPVNSSIIGFFDRYSRINYCRKTSFTQNKPEKWNKCLNYIKRVDELFKLNAREQYERQSEVARSTSPDFLIPGTAFTTVTLNKNFRTAFHRDAGDLPQGFGCLTYIQTGKFAGGDIVYPAWGLRIKQSHRDLLLFDPHEVHGNTEIKPISKDYERITGVFYYRKNMIYCGTVEEELLRAKSHKGDNIIGPTTEDLNNGRWS